MEEYTGVSPSFTLYATTTYQYDTLGNLTKVTDINNNQTNMTYDTLSRKTSMTDPDMGSWIYQYDANGNLTYQKDAKNQAIYFQYDPLNRLRQKDYGTQKALGSGDIVYTYDEASYFNPKGRLTTLKDLSGTTNYSYDSLGRITRTEKTIDSVLYATETTYDALNRTDTIKYPDNPVTTIKYEYDTGGNLLRVKNNSNNYPYATYTGYNAMGQVGTITYGNGVTTAYQYRSDNNRLQKILTKNSSQTEYMNLTYADYDNVGNIENIIDSIDPSRTRTFVYDELNRLTTANSTSYGGNLEYQYDKIGNMTYNCKYGYYYYDDTNHRHAVTKVVKNGVTINYAYDANGNMTSGAGRSFTYDYDNRPTRITYGSYTTDSIYDAYGNRVKKIIMSGATSTTIYVSQLYECNINTGTCTKYIFAGSQRIVQIDSSGTYFYHTDHLGSSNIITNSLGNKVQDIYYYPYGEIKTNTGTIDVEHKFTGQEWDAETGLYYYGARYYDPRLARFISADTIVPEPFNPQSLNRYSYVLNNPVMIIDPDGHLDVTITCCNPGSGGPGMDDPRYNTWNGNPGSDGDPWDYWGNLGGGNNQAPSPTPPAPAPSPTPAPEPTPEPVLLLPASPNSLQSSYFNAGLNINNIDLTGNNNNIFYNFPPGFARNIDILQRTLYGESRGTPEAMVHVGWVMKNRADEWFGGDYEKAKHGITGNVRGGFDVWNPRDKNYAKILNPPLHIPAEKTAWENAGIAALTVYFSPIDPTFGATMMYHVDRIPFRGTESIRSSFTTVTDKNGLGWWIFYK